MALRLTKGVSSLALLPLRVRIIAGLALLFFATILLISETSKSQTESASVDGGIGESATHVKAVSGQQAVAEAQSVVKTAKIVTCPRCRLNALPLVKKFVFQHAKLFEPNLKVDFIPGEDPTLYLYENGKQVAEIDLEVRQSIIQFSSIHNAS